MDIAFVFLFAMLGASAIVYAGLRGPTPPKPAEPPEETR